MADALPSFETKDLEGTTAQFNGTVGTSSTAIPAVPGTEIQRVTCKQPASDSSNKNLLVSFDGGTTFFTLEPGLALDRAIKGKPTQIHIKGNVASTGYEIILDREL